MYNDNLIIVGYDFGYGYNSYYVDRKNSNIGWPSDNRIARAIDLLVNDNDSSDYNIDDVVVKTNQIVNKKVVTTYYNLKLVKLYKSFKCKKPTTDQLSTNVYLKPRIYYPKCNKVNVLCSSLRGAVVSPNTLCRQSMYWSSLKSTKQKKERRIFSSSLFFLWQKNFFHYTMSRLPKYRKDFIC